MTQPVSRQSKRTCENCTTILSIYNESQTCSLHETLPDVLIVAPKQVAEAPRRVVTPIRSPIKSYEHDYQISRDLSMLRKAITKGIRDLELDGIENPRNLDAERYMGVKESWK